MPGAAEKLVGTPWYSYRPCELVVEDADADWVAERLPEYEDATPDELIGARVLRLPDGIDLPGLASQLRVSSPRGKAGNVGVNHMMGTPKTHGNPFSLAIPVEEKAIPEPPEAWAGYGEQFAVGVVDTGIVDRPLLHGRYVQSGGAAADIEDLDVNGDGRLDPQAGHGTFVSGLVLQYAPAAVIDLSGALNSFGVASEAEVALGLSRIRKAMRDSAELSGRELVVVNLSLGCYTQDDLAPVTVRAALRALGPECVVVAAAGNDRTTRPFWPAAERRVVAVGAVDAHGRRAWFSNTGPWVDVSAPGVGAVSTFVEHGEFHGAARWDGTSFSAPRIAGAIAALMGKYGDSAQEAMRRLLTRRGLPCTSDLGVVYDEQALRDLLDEPVRTSSA